MSRFRPFLHLLLFLLTLFTTAVAGVQWLNLDPFDLRNFPLGIEYACAILFILASHEFGHYFAARHHGVSATLPYFIPFPNLPGFINFGTLGAVIRTRSAVPSKKVMFDIGVAGPITGFVATLLVLIYGFTHLPGTDYILRIHPDYFTHAPDGLALTFGNTLLYQALSLILTNPSTQFVPPMSEMYHYPFLCAGWFGLFVTAMNLIPIGQLDGGHIAYAMFGRGHRYISRICFGLLLVLGLVSLLPLIGVGVTIGWFGWLIWALILLFMIRLDHPPVLQEEPLDDTRRLVGWTAFLMFALSFSPSPFMGI